MILHGRGLSDGTANGHIIKSTVPISFLGDVNRKSGTVEKNDSELFGKSLKENVLVFPTSTGSTVGSYAIYGLKKNNVAPLAMIAELGEPIVTAGANIASIPFVDKIDISLLLDGDTAEVNGSTGVIKLLNKVREEEVVTAVLIDKTDRVLLLKRSDRVSSYVNQWSAISGRIESGETDEEAAIREIYEETSIKNVKLIRKSDMIYVRNKDILYRIQPLLYMAKENKVKLNWENISFQWTDIKDINKYTTVPKLDIAIKKLVLNESGEGSKLHSVSGSI